MFYQITIPDYDTADPFIQFSASVGPSLLTFTFLFIEGDWICRVYDVTNSEQRSFTLRSNATYFNYDPIYSILFGELPSITVNTLTGLVFEVRDNIA